MGNGRFLVLVLWGWGRCRVLGLLAWLVIWVRVLACVWVSWLVGCFLYSGASICDAGFFVLVFVLLVWKDAKGGVWGSEEGGQAQPDNVAGQNGQANQRIAVDFDTVEDLTGNGGFRS